MEPPVVAARVVATLSAGDSSLSIAMHAPACRCEPALFLLPLVGRVGFGTDTITCRITGVGTTPNHGYVTKATRATQCGMPTTLSPSTSTDAIIATTAPVTRTTSDSACRSTAPAAGLIIEVTDDRPDDGSWEVAESAEDPNSLLGNRVVIDHEDETFSHLAHIRQGSAAVTVGQRVDAGDHLGAVGNSGSSIFPHLHYQRADAPTMLGEGVPSTFTNIVLDRGNRTYPINGHIDSGDILHAE